MLTESMTSMLLPPSVPSRSVPLPTGAEQWVCLGSVFRGFSRPCIVGCCTQSHRALERPILQSQRVTVYTELLRGSWRFLGEKSLWSRHEEGGGGLAQAGGGEAAGMRTPPPPSALLGLDEALLLLAHRLHLRVGRVT